MTLPAPNFPLMRAPKVGGMKNIFTHKRNYYSMAAMHLKAFWEMTPNKDSRKISFQEDDLEVMIDVRIIRLKDHPTFCILFEDNSALILSNWYDIQFLVQPMVFQVSKMHAHDDALIVAHASAWQKFMRNKSFGKENGPDPFFQSFPQNPPSVLQEGLDHFLLVMRVLFADELDNTFSLSLNGGIPSWAGKWHACPDLSFNRTGFENREFFKKNPNVIQALHAFLGDLVASNQISLHNLIGYEIKREDTHYYTKAEIRRAFQVHNELSRRYNNVESEDYFYEINILDMFKQNSLSKKVQSPPKSLSAHQKEAITLFSQYQNSRTNRITLCKSHIKREKQDNKTSHEKMAILARESASFSWLERHSPQCLSLFQTMTP